MWRYGEQTGACLLVLQHLLKYYGIGPDQPPGLEPSIDAAGVPIGEVHGGDPANALPQKFGVLAGAMIAPSR